MDIDYSEFYNKVQEADISLAALASRRYVEILRPYLPANKAAKILEIGPGNGLTLRLLMDMGYTNTTGLEVDARLAEAAKAKGYNVLNVPADSLPATLRAQANCWDLVFCMHVIEHVPKDKQVDFIQSTNTCLAKNGYFVCETPNALSPVANYFRHNDWTHTSIFTQDSLSFLLRANHFEIIYSGGSKARISPPSSNPVAAILKSCCVFILRLLSTLISRIHYTAEFGLKGLHLPLESSILVVGKKT
jgi:2-polyprenyl-3-methyl-5-hydroxy-6-metoxy-1,4-benzoquinol methylase